jgi:hypothetical protein
MKFVLLFLTMASTIGAAAPPMPRLVVDRWCYSDQRALCPRYPTWNGGQLGVCFRSKAHQVSAVCKVHHPRLFGAKAPVGPYLGR